MANLNVTVTASEGKKKETKRLTSFAIGESIVRTELAVLNKESRQAKIREYALKFLTPEQAQLDFICTVGEENTSPSTSEVAEEKTEEAEIAHCE